MKKKLWEPFEDRKIISKEKIQTFVRKVSKTMLHVYNYKNRAKGLSLTLKIMSQMKPNNSASTP